MNSNSINKEEKKKSNLSIRILVSLVFGPLIILFIYLGNYYFFSLITFLSAIGVYELSSMFEKFYKKQTIKILPILASIVISFLFFYEKNNLIIPLIIFYTTLIGIIYILKSDIDKTCSLISNDLFSLIYVSFFFSHLILLRNYKFTDSWTNLHGFIVVLMIFILTWACDSFAYFIGIGIKWKIRYKMSPVISPNKSIQGAIGGFISTIIIGFLFNFLSAKFLNISLNNTNILILTFVCGIIGQFGDLFESLIKRNFDIKDSSNIIPGHGGVLDRFDALIFNGVFAFYLLKIFNS